MVKKSKTSEDLLSKLPPQSAQAESGVLASILIDKDAIIKIGDILSIEDFYEIKHAKIYEAIIYLFKHQKPIDVLTVVNRLEEKEDIEDIGGAEYIAELANLLPTAANVIEYAQIVKHKSVLRRMIAVGQTITSLGYEQDKGVGDILNEAESMLFKISHAHLKNNFLHISKIVDNIYETIAKIREESKDGPIVRGVPSGFKNLDMKLSGFQPSDLVVIAARPSVGKTAFAINLAMNAALHHGKNIGIFSLEMSKEQLVERIFCMLMEVDSFKLKTGQLTDDQMQTFAESMDLLNDTNLFFDDDADCSIVNLRTKARRLKMEHGLDMIIIDYIQLMQGEDRYSGNRVLEVSEISRGLKSVARELQIPVLALSQLSRAVESRSDKEPQLSDLRDSGSIEQDADVVMMLHRDDYYEGADAMGTPVTDLNVLIKKHRNGPTGKVVLSFDKSKQRMYSIDKTYEEPGQ